LSLAFFYWIDNLGFITERKLAAIHQTFSWGFQLAGYFTSSTNAIKLSGIIITAPSPTCTVARATMALVHCFLLESVASGQAGLMVLSWWCLTLLLGFFFFTNFLFLTVCIFIATRALRYCRVLV
jgi:hypothetical protein